MGVHQGLWLGGQVLQPKLPKPGRRDNFHGKGIGSHRVEKGVQIMAGLSNKMDQQKNQDTSDFSKYKNSLRITLREIDAFVAFSETGSVNKAAARLNMTQSAISRRIQNFEFQIGGAPLLDRSVKPARLTSAGAYVLVLCRRALDALAELETSSRHSVDPVGHFKIGVAHGLGDFVLLAPLDALRHAFPRLALRVSSGWSQGLLEDVRKGHIDCAVALLTDAHGPIDGETRTVLGEEELIIVAGNHSGLNFARPHRIADIADGNWFLNPHGCGCRAALMKACDRIGRPLRITAEVFGEELQLAMIARGGGLGLVMRRQLERSSYRKQLKIVPIEDFHLAAKLTFITKSVAGRFNAVFDQFVLHMHNYFKDEHIA
jgi:DNA-binding transcriptional LysR family regulator